jgi:hypothetical protein
MFFKIGSKDFSHLVAEMKVGYEQLVADTSGRNAYGIMRIHKVGEPKRKVYITLRHTFEDEMAEFLQAIENYEVVVSFLNPQTKAMTTITCYIGTPEPEYYTISDKIIYKPMSLNFIEE